MKTRIVVAIAAASLIPLSGSPNASVLCTKKAGAVFLRSGESCGRKETRLSQFLGRGLRALGTGHALLLAAVA